MAEIPHIPVLATPLPAPVLTQIQESKRLKFAHSGDEAELTLEEFAEHVDMPLAWVKKNLRKIPGRFTYSNKCHRIHWGTHKQEMQKRDCRPVRRTRR